MKKYFYFLAIIGITGCSSNHFLYKDEKGMDIYEAGCDTIGNCYMEAQKQCPSGFNTVDKTINPRGDLFSIQLIYKCK